MSSAQNHLIELLPRPDRQRLLAVCEPQELRAGELLCEAGKPLPAAIFPVDACIVLLMPVADHPSVEVGMLGREGMLGAPLALGVAQMPSRGQVQGAGRAWRVEVAALRHELALSTALRELLHRFLFVRMAQMAGSSACLRFHHIGPRLARWLLMSHDRAHGAPIEVTHQTLAATLGVRRVGITTAAGKLQRQGLIAYHRGHLTVLDRAGLERAACRCYAADKAAYREQLD